MSRVSGLDLGSRNAFLACGFQGTCLDDGERAALVDLAPAGVVLFARNVGDRDQLHKLVGELRALPSSPYIAVDLEGGRVNRLEKLIGQLPSAARAAAAGPEAVGALGAAIGAACAHFGIGVDFAPVLDIAHADGFLGAENRCFGTNAPEVARYAALYTEAIERFGVATCLKHYPGLGTGAVDSHKELPVLGDDAAHDAEVFATLASPARAVMVAHALVPSLGEAYAPASLSRSVIARLGRAETGPVIADDLEMGALGAYGSMGERAAAALAAGCDQVLVCNAMPARAQVIAHVADWTGRDASLALDVRRAAERVAGFGHGTLAEVTWALVEELTSLARGLAGVGA